MLPTENQMIRNGTLHRKLSILGSHRHRHHHVGRMYPRPISNIIAARAKRDPLDFQLLDPPAAGGVLQLEICRLVFRMAWLV